MAIPLEAIEGKYEILEKISEGGMGAVYKVRHRFLEEMRVIKVMRPHLVSDERAQDRFMREAKLAGGLHHPNIAHVYDFAVDEQGNAFLVLEYIEGVTLLELVKEVGPPPLGLVLEIARQCLGALAFLHHRSIIHRDISPDNIMVGIDQDGELFAKLIDLGIAKLEGADAGLTATGMFVGKVKYSSPEHFKASEGVKVDARSDLYSLGVVLYELLTGHHPIPGTGVSNLIAGHLFHQPEPFARVDPECRVPPELQSIVYRSLAKKPADRFANAEVMAAELASVQEQHELILAPLAKVLLKRRVEAAASLKDPGSTQRHLDLQFGKGPLAVPGPHQRAVTTPGGLEMPTEELGMRGRQVAADMSLAATGVTPTGVPARPAETDEATRVLETADTTAAARRAVPSLPWLAAIVVALVVVAALVVGVMQWRQRQQPAAAVTGVLVVDAVPWAEVRAVTDESGSPVALTEDPAYTPLRLSLPPGVYQVVVSRNGEERNLPVEVRAGGSVRVLPVFTEVDVDGFFHGLGL